MADFESQLFKLNLFKNFDNHDFSKAPDQLSNDKDENSLDDSGDSLVMPNFVRRVQKDQQSNDGINTISEKKQERINTNNSQRSKSAYSKKQNDNQSAMINILLGNKAASKDVIYSTPKKGNYNMNQSYLNGQQQDTTSSSNNRNLIRTAQSNYIQSNEKDRFTSLKKGNGISNGSGIYNKKHLSQSCIENEDLSDDSNSEDRELQRKRNFEQNMEIKRQILESEFEQEEDRRRAHLKQLKDSQKKSQFRDILDGWVNLNKKKQMQLEQLYTKCDSKDIGKPPRLLFKSLENIRSKNRSISGGTDNVQEKSQFQQKQTFHTKNNHSFGYIIPQAQYLSSTQEFFPIKYEKDSNAIQEKTKNIQQEIERVESLIFNQNQIYQNMQHEVTDLGFQINKRRKSINGKSQLRNEFEEKKSQFNKIKVKIDINLKQTKRTLKSLDEQYQQVDETSKDILSEQVKRAIENQVVAKHQKNNMCNVLIQIDKQKQLLEETEQQIQDLDLIAEQFNQRNQEQLDLLQEIKMLDDLNSLFVEEQVKYYLNNSKLEDIEKYINKDQSILFDNFNLESPLIKYKQQSFQYSPNQERQNFLQTIDNFYERHPEGPIGLSDKLIQKFQFLSNQFEGFKMAYNDLNLIKSEKTVQNQDITQELDQVREAQQNSPKRILEKKSIQSEIDNTQRSDIIQSLYIEKDLNKGIQSFQQTQVLKEDSERYEKSLLYSFMGLVESHIRKAKILLLMQDQCKVNLGEDFRDQVISNIEKINKMIRNDVKVMKKQISEKKFEIPQEFMKDMGSFKRNLGMKLLSQAKLTDNSPKKKELENNNILILFNEFSELLLNNHKSIIEPDNSVLEKWIFAIKNDNIIYGFANHTMIKNFIQNLPCSEEDSRDPTFSYIFQNLHLLKESAWECYEKSVIDIMELEQQLLQKIKQKSDEQMNILMTISPRFQNKRSKDLRKNMNLTFSKFPYLPEFENHNHTIIEENQEAIQRLENQVDNPTETPIERKKETNESKIRKAEFDIEFFLEKLKTDGKKNLKKELIENDEIARKMQEQERRRSSLLYKTDQEEYFQFKESQHFINNVDEVKKLSDQQPEGNKVVLQKYPHIFQNFNDNNKPNKNHEIPSETRNQVSIRKRIISCDSLKKKQSTISYQDFIKPDQIGSARKNLALNSNLINHISRLDALTQSIDQEQLERILKQQKIQVEDISKIMTNSSTVKQKKLSAYLASSSAVQNKRRSQDQIIQEENHQESQSGQRTRNVSAFTYLTKIRTEASTEKKNELNELQKINKQLFLQTLKDPISNKKIIERIEKYNQLDKSANNKNSKSEQTIKKPVLPYRRSFHSILSSILDEQIRIKGQYSGGQQNKDPQQIKLIQKEYQPEYENQQQSNKLKQYNMTFGETLKSQDDYQQGRTSLIKPQRVENQQDQLKNSQSQTLQKFLNLKVYTKGNKSLKYIKNTQE